VTLIQNNLMTRPGYSPYCGGENCKQMPRTIFDGEQFKCPHCRWRSAFTEEFIAAYKQKWGIK
jgi:hypothetical protein